jgi:hypothetical protein
MKHPNARLEALAILDELERGEPQSDEAARAEREAREREATRMKTYREQEAARLKELRQRETAMTPEDRAERARITEQVRAGSRAVDEQLRAAKAAALQRAKEWIASQTAANGGAQPELARLVETGDYEGLAEETIRTALDEIAAEPALDPDLQNVIGFIRSQQTNGRLQDLDQLVAAGRPYRFPESLLQRGLEHLRSN